MYIAPLRCIYSAPSRILAFWLMLSVLRTTLNKAFLSYLIYLILHLITEHDDVMISLTLCDENPIGDRGFPSQRSSNGGNLMLQQCFNALIDIYHEFMLLFYCCVLLENKLTTTATVLLLVWTICWTSIRVAVIWGAMKLMWRQYDKHFLTRNHYITILTPEDHFNASISKHSRFDIDNTVDITGLILGLRPANEKGRYKVTPSLIGWAQT